MNLLSPNEKNAAGTKGKRTQLEKQKMVAEMNSQEMEKSSLELIREKIMDYDLMVAEKQARQIGQQRRKGLINSKSRISEDEQQVIAEE